MPHGWGSLGRKRSESIGILLAAIAPKRNARVTGGEAYAPILPKMRTIMALFP